jgi:hypothetical protein
MTHIRQKLTLNQKSSHKHVCRLLNLLLVVLLTIRQQYVSRILELFVTIQRNVYGFVGRYLREISNYNSATCLEESHHPRQLEQLNQPVKTHT